jgi:hypothetical protein
LIASARDDCNSPWRDERQDEFCCFRRLCQQTSNDYFIPRPMGRLMSKIIQPSVFNLNPTT